jgi:septum site-determining protein MinD
MKTISIHSSRGGTGKTVIATNLSCILANRGFSVALLDLDFRAPSLAIIFSRAINSQVYYWLNDFLNGKCDRSQVTVDLSKSYNFRGKLLVGLANPSIADVQNVIYKSQAWELAAIKKLFFLLSYYDKHLLVDYCILDTSPGVQYSSINALTASDLCIMVINSDMVDLEVTKNILNDVNDVLEKKTVIILNKYYPESRLNVNKENDSEIKVATVLKHSVVSKIPCYCDVLQADRTAILAIEKQAHPFIKHLEEVADKLDSL